MDRFRSLTVKNTQLLIRLSFTFILLGYFLVWLPQPAAGLSFIGLEIAEWVKFIPKVQAGNFFPSRNFFYLPPTTLAMMMAMWTAGWSNNSWRTWITRALAVLISLLVFPAFESIQGEPVSQWQIRIFFIFLVGASVVLAAYYSRENSRLPESVPWSYFLVVGFIGLILPLWSYLAIRPLAEAIIGGHVGIGIGLVLNFIGHLLLVLLSLLYIVGRTSPIDLLAGE